MFQELNKPDLGRKESRNRLQHTSHVRKILEDLEPNGTNIDVLSGDEGNIVWTDWVDPKMESLRAGTIRSYLGSYEMFLDFVTQERVRAGVVPELDTDVAKIFRNTVKKLKQGWQAFWERAYLKVVTRVLAKIWGSTRPSDNSNQYQKVDCDGMP